MSNFIHTELDDWHWLPATFTDIQEIVSMAQSHFQHEVDGIFTQDPVYFEYNLTQAILTQNYFPNAHLIMVARNKQNNNLMAWTYLGRHGSVAYAKEEIAEARFIHTDLSLPVKTRIKLIAQTLHIWIAYCHHYQIPVLVSTTIRTDQQAFMKLHQRLGFLIRGSIAYRRII